MKQIDYLKLVATGRKSVHYARPSDADDALTGLIGLSVISALILVFVIAVIASYLGAEIDKDTLAWPFGSIVLPAIAYFVASLFIGGAPRLVRVAFIGVALVTLGLRSYKAFGSDLSSWYLFVPAVLLASLSGLGAFRQL